MQARSSDRTSDARAAGSDTSDEFERACLLLLLGQQPGSGGELWERLQTAGLAGSDRAQVDRTLRALERVGLVCPIGLEAGRTDCTYRLTAAGAERLDGATEALRRAQVTIGWFLARCGEQLVAPRIR